MRWALLLLSGCWTGSTTEPLTNAYDDTPSELEITMQRTACLGECPVYEVSIDDKGRVKWRGTLNVVATGERRASVPPKRMREIEKKLAKVRFFERDERGELPDNELDCVTQGSRTS